VLLSVIAASQSTVAAGTPPTSPTEPWGEITRQETIVSGALTITGLNLVECVAVRLIISGVTVTTDDSQVLLRFYINGSEVSGASDYQWGMRQMGGTSTTIHDAADSEIHLTAETATMGVGNAASESFHSTVTVTNPAGTTHKKAHIKSVWIDAPGNYRSATYAGGQLNNAGAITGFKVFGSSDLTAGSIVLLGVV